MTSEECITIIKDRLLNLINSGQLKATFRPSDSTFSFYYNDIDIGERPLLTLRLANHNPQYQHYIHPELTPPSEGYNMNISIEFYKPKLKRNGRIKRNRINPNVTVPEDIHGVVPFVVNSYEYIPEKLDEEDIDKIYENILAWIYNDFNIDYNDPLKGTDKEAYPQSKIANITWNISHNISVDNEGNYQSAYGHGADYVSESKNIYKYNQNNCNRNMRKNKQVVRLTESQLHNIIGESVKKIINEMNYNVPEDEEALQEHLDLISQFMHGYFQGDGMTSSNPYEYLSSAIEQTQSLLSGLNTLARRRNSN